jgi:hypothetical protein
MVESTTTSTETTVPSSTTLRVETTTSPEVSTSTQGPTTVSVSTSVVLCVVPVVGDVCTVVVSSVTVGLVVLTDTVVGPWVDVLTWNQQQLQQRQQYQAVLLYV